ncbi:hypothetical protein MYRA21_3267 [Myroides sp. A21]|nr:hypothetical protein MYRA21_3267 [Myroides sp. A21]
MFNKLFKIHVNRLIVKKKNIFKLCVYKILVNFVLNITYF